MFFLGKIHKRLGTGTKKVESSKDMLQSQRRQSPLQIIFLNKNGLSVSIQYFK